MPIKNYNKQFAKIEQLAKEAGYTYYRGMAPEAQIKTLTEAFAELGRLKANMDKMRSRALEVIK